MQISRLISIGFDSDVLIVEHRLKVTSVATEQNVMTKFQTWVISTSEQVSAASLAREIGVAGTLSLALGVLTKARPNGDGITRRTDDLGTRQSGWHNGI
jgi:hypothetical protein